MQIPIPGRTVIAARSPSSMGGMGSMMAFGWIGALLIVAVVVAGVVLLAKSPGGSGSNLLLTVLAVIGGVALIGVAAMALMHAGGMACCG
jgi:hypothetical protein